jgi:hypothetical protein
MGRMGDISIIENLTSVVTDKREGAPGLSDILGRSAGPRRKLTFGKTNFRFAR